MITLIAAIGRNREMGFKNQLLCHIPNDMAHFKSYTWGKVVIMGYKTFESIGKPLPGRKNIVVTHNHHLLGKAVEAHSIESALSIEHCYPELVVIGGETIYNQTMSSAAKLLITQIDADFEADAFFPVIDSTVWKINNIVDGGSEPYNYKFIEYVRNESRGDIK